MSYSDSTVVVCQVFDTSLELRYQRFNEKLKKGFPRDIAVVSEHTSQVALLKGLVAQ